VKGGPNIVDGRWHAIVCAKMASGISLRVDGQTVASKAIVVGSISSSIGVYLGRKPDGTDAYTGLMDEVSIAFVEEPEFRWPLLSNRDPFGLWSYAGGATRVRFGREPDRD
jgi:hypothetical protein